MNRVLPPLLTLCLALSLLLGAGVGGYIRTAHAIANAGQIQMIVCSTEGAQEITLDRNGEPVDTKHTGECAHCAACSLTPIATLPAAAFAARHIGHSPRIAITMSVLPNRAERIEHASRGPPSTSKV